jgi:putative amide transporter protein
MIFAVLMIFSIVLFFDGFFVLGKYAGKQVAWLNLGGGLSLWVIGLFIGMTDNLHAFGATQSFVAAATCVVFALFYLLLAAEIIAGTDFKGLGYFCFMAGLAMFLLGLGYFHILGTTLVHASQFGVFWILWAILLWLVWIVWGLGKTALAPFTGYACIFLAFATGLYPAIAFFNLARIGW